MPFLNSIDKLNKKIAELEDKIELLSSQEKTLNESGVCVYNKKLLNCCILNQKTVNLFTLSNTEKCQLFIQLKIKFYNFSSQDIQFKLFADKILICQETNNYQNNNCEIILSGVYKNTVLDYINLQVQIIAKGEKQVNLTETILTIWGNNIENSVEEYDAIETNSNIFLSYISNNQLFYKHFNKSIDCESVDFIFLDNAISHSVCNFNDELYLFRVDASGNLFYCNLLDKNEKFISHNVRKIACCGTNSEIIFSYISDGNVYYGTIYNNTVISNNQLNSLKGHFINCHLNFNPYNNKCYLLLTKKDSSNYLLESIPSNFSSSENICAEISLNISVT